MELHLRRPHTFASWISNPAFGLAVADQDLGDDPDGDGIHNGVENFFGTNPGILHAGTRRRHEERQHLHLHPPAERHSRHRPHRKLPLVHRSRHLYLGGGATSGGTTVTFTTQANTPSPGITTVTATVTGTAASKLFVRVNVTQP